MRKIAQRRPEITPGYDAPRREGQPVLPARSTKAGDYPRLRRPHPFRWTGRCRKPLNEGRRLPPATTLDTSRGRIRKFRPLNEGRRLPPATTHVAGRAAVRIDRRSTKAGDYPRLRREPAGRHLREPLGSAQRRPEITPGYDLFRSSRHCAGYRRSTKAGDYPRLRPGTPTASGPPGTALNEGRRLPPATTRRAALYIVLRSCAQRRPEITPGYDHCRLHPSPRVRPAQRRPEITPGYDLRPHHPGTRRQTRSTKAGDYPRLRPRNSPTPPPTRSAALNEGRRLPPATTSRTPSIPAQGSAAQRRPEITPGYDPLAEGRGRPQITFAQRRPEITPGYDPLAEGRGRPQITFAQRRPEITPGYDRQNSTWLMKRTPYAQRRPEITPGYDLQQSETGSGAVSRSTKAGDYPRLRPELLC